MRRSVARSYVTPRGKGYHFAMRTFLSLGASAATLSLLLAAGPATKPAAMKLVNPSFEDGLTGWDNKGDNGMSVLSAEAAKDGKQGVRVTDDTDASGSSLYSAPLPAKAGTTYSLTFQSRVVEGERGMTVYLQFLDVDGKLLTRRADNNEITVSVRGSEWKPYSVNGVAPENATRVRIWIHTSSGAKGLKVDLDDFKLVELAH